MEEECWEDIPLDLKVFIATKLPSGERSVLFDADPSTFTRDTQAYVCKDLLRKCVRKWKRITGVWKGAYEDFPTFLGLQEHIPEDAGKSRDIIVDPMYMWLSMRPLQQYYSDDTVGLYQKQRLCMAALCIFAGRNYTVYDSLLRLYNTCMELLVSRTVHACISSACIQKNTELTDQLSYVLMDSDSQMEVNLKEILECAPCIVFRALLF